MRTSGSPSAGSTAQGPAVPRSQAHSTCAGEYRRAPSGPCRQRSVGQCDPQTVGTPVRQGASRDRRYTTRPPLADAIALVAARMRCCMLRLRAAHNEQWDETNWHKRESGGRTSMERWISACISTRSSVRSHRFDLASAAAGCRAWHRGCTTSHSASVCNTGTVSSARKRSSSSRAM